VVPWKPSCLAAALLLVTTVGMWLGLTPPAGAHAFLSGSDPAPEAVLDDLPGAVRLSFSEPVEVNASLFKVYPLAADDDLLRLKAAAGQLVSRVLRQRGDEDQRADAGVAADRGASSEIQILLKEGLAPGPYVVMWRVLSVDTHVTEGFFVFIVQPAGEE